MARQKLSTEERQEQIVAAARKIITQEGMENLTIEALAEAVGLSEGAIYRHFESKQDILLLVLDDVRHALEDILHDAGREEQTPLESLGRVLREHLSSAERREGVSFLVISEALRGNNPELEERTSQVMGSYLEAIEDIVRRGQESGGILSEVDPRAAALLFLGMVQASVTVWALKRRVYSLQEQHEMLWSTFQRTLTCCR